LFQGFLEGLNTCSTFFSETNVELDKMARRAEAAEDALDGSEVRIRIFAKISIMLHRVFNCFLHVYQKRQKIYLLSY
jgi:hypothetical protein